MMWISIRRILIVRHIIDTKASLIPSCIMNRKGVEIMNLNIRDTIGNCVDEAAEKEREVIEKYL